MDEERQAKFLTAYAKEGTITHAARTSGMTWNYHYTWMKSDPEYPDRFREAAREFMDTVEKAAIKRAVKGWKEPVFQQGVEVGTRRRYSDRLLQFVLQGRRPEVYGRKVELAGPGGEPLTVRITLPDNGRDTTASNARPDSV